MSATIAQGQTPEAIIQTASNRLMVIEKQERATFKNNPQRMYNRVQALLRPITDIASVARGVMGSYYKTATAQQRKRFVQNFEKSLVKIYSDSLMKVIIKDIKPMPVRASKSSRKRSVGMRLSTQDGKVHQVVYSLILSKQNQWKIRNIIVDGVNFGLTYRNQFKSEMTRSGNLDQVIANWAKTVTKK
jgi:phospholipid transport system substrate-binding protein